MDKLDTLSLRTIAKNKIHHSDDHFINPFSHVQYGNLWRLLRWRLFSTNYYKDLYKNEKVIPVKIDWKTTGSPNDISITFIKHSSVYINYLGKGIIVDPVFFGLFPFIRDFTPLAFDVSDIPGPDIVLITHGHYDHLDIPSLKKLPNHSLVVAPLGYDDLLQGAGFKQMVCQDWYDKFTVDGLSITLLPCNHWTMRNPFVGPNKALWGSFLLSAGPRRPSIFISGDTAHFRGFKEIGQEFDIDLAIINLGAYEPRWFMAQSHLSPSEAACAFLELGANRLMVVHWGTFRLGDEPVYLPQIEIAREMEELGMAQCLIPIRHGETFRF